MKVEGIHRVPGDSDFVSELKLRIDRSNYTPDGVDDPHVLASLLKLWLCKLCDPLMHEEMYKDCIMFVYNVLMHLKCDQIDADNDIVPVIALVPVYHRPRLSNSRNRK